MSGPGDRLQTTLEGFQVEGGGAADLRLRHPLEDAQPERQPDHDPPGQERPLPVRARRASSSTLTPSASLPLTAKWVGTSSAVTDASTADERTPASTCRMRMPLATVSGSVSRDRPRRCPWR